ncbi:MAG: hypothetical protein LPJ98_10455, partial [Cyclobacteriaceae bacterium]|nr:hypothetical protein [Cyclobacteriaceae bacterium]
MKKIILFSFALSALFSQQIFGQGAYVPFNRDYYHLIERYEILDGKNNSTFHTGFKPYRRDQVGAFLDSLSYSGLLKSKSDRFNLEYLSNDNWEFVGHHTGDSDQPLLKKLYR